jgi:class 3 adenylate cyclase
MTPLRTVVLMKTDIAGSTPRFRALLAADRQSLLSEHRAFLANHAANQGGQIIKSAGDGYWLKFLSVTAAARSAIAMQEALILAQPNKGVDRLSMRVVIGLGDVAVLDGELDGDLLALMVRIEGITPADEIYLTSAARHALTPAEVQTAYIDEFALKGFTELAPVYRVEHVGARLRSHKFSPIEMSLQAADKPRRKRHHCRPQIRRGGVKGRSRRQPVRAAQPLRPLRLISTLHMPCDQPRCDQGVIEAVMARDARPFEGDPGASRLFGGRCRATCPRWRLGAYSACRAFTIASTADSRLLSTMVPG